MTAKLVRRAWEWWRRNGQQVLLLAALVWMSAVVLILWDIKASLYWIEMVLRFGSVEIDAR